MPTCGWHIKQATEVFLWSVCNTCQLKKYSQSKSWELCFIWWDFLGLKPRRQHLKLLWENCSEKFGSGRSYIELCNQDQVVWTSEVFLWVKENKISQVKEFSAFLCMVRCKSLGWLKSFLSYASQISGASILYFSHPDFLWAHRREWLQPDDCQITGISLLVYPHGSGIYMWKARIADECDMVELPSWLNLFTVVAGNTPFLNSNRNNDIWDK